MERHQGIRQTCLTGFIDAALNSRYAEVAETDSVTSVIDD